MKKTAKVITTSADPYVENLLQNISEGKRVLKPAKGEKIFSQGDRADAIFFIQSGKVKITEGIGSLQLSTTQSLRQIRMLV